MREIFLAREKGLKARPPQEHELGAHVVPQLMGYPLFQASQKEWTVNTRK
jgi:hypothetical protein